MLLLSLISIFNEEKNDKNIKLNIYHYTFIIILKRKFVILFLFKL